MSLCYEAWQRILIRCVCHLATSAVRWLESKHFVRPAKMNFAVADTHRGNGKPFIVRADEKLISFVELESAIRTRGEVR
jgi:hypothetical protein